jgi:hypothetical protein
MQTSQDYKYSLLAELSTTKGQKVAGELPPANS